MGAQPPLPLAGRDDSLKEIVLNAEFTTRSVLYVCHENRPARYIADLTKLPKLAPAEVVVRPAQRSRGAFAPQVNGGRSLRGSRATPSS